MEWRELARKNADLRVTAEMSSPKKTRNYCATIRECQRQYQGGFDRYSPVSFSPDTRAARLIVWPRSALAAQIRAKTYGRRAAILSRGRPTLFHYKRCELRSDVPIAIPMWLKLPRWRNSWCGTVSCCPRTSRNPSVRRRRHAAALAVCHSDRLSAVQ